MPNEKQDAVIVKSVRINKNRKNKILGWCSLSIDGPVPVDVDDVRIVEGSKGVFVGTPDKLGKDKGGNDKRYRYVKFPTEHGRAAVQAAVLNAYNAALEAEKSTGA